MTLKGSEASESVYGGALFVGWCRLIPDKSGREQRAAFATLSDVKRHRTKRSETHMIHTLTHVAPLECHSRGTNTTWAPSLAFKTTEGGVNPAVLSESTNGVCPQ